MLEERLAVIGDARDDRVVGDCKRCEAGEKLADPCVRAPDRVIVRSRHERARRVGERAPTASARAESPGSAPAGAVPRSRGSFRTSVPVDLPLDRRRIGDRTASACRRRAATRRTACAIASAPAIRSRAGRSRQRAGPLVEHDRSRRRSRTSRAPSPYRRTPRSRSRRRETRARAWAPCQEAPTARSRRRVVPHSAT